MEFALVSPVMMLMLMGFYDLGHGVYVRSVLQGAVQKAGRDSGLETGSANAATIDQTVRNQVGPVAGPTASFSSSRLNYSSFSDVGRAENYTDTNSNGRRDPGECYVDENGNASWDADLGLNGQGGASDVVLYTMTVSYPRLFPMGRLLGWSSNVSVSASTVLRNQPYGAQSTIAAVTICT